MVSGIRIYVEGGGEGKHAKLRFRKGFSTFLGTLRDNARSKGIRWRIIVSGPRGQAYRNFKNALKDHQQDFNVLLVDSEGPVTEATGPRRYLQDTEKWDLTLCEDKNCHLMVQIMEAWFVADVDALVQYFGSGFNRNVIPGHSNVEQIPKPTLEKAFQEATGHVPKKGAKGPYQKGRHSSEILKILNPVKVRKAAQHCNRLFEVLDGEIKATS